MKYFILLSNVEVKYLDDHAKEYLRQRFKCRRECYHIVRGHWIKVLLDYLNCKESNNIDFNKFINLSFIEVDPSYCGDKNEILKMSFKNNSTAKLKELIKETLNFNEYKSYLRQRSEQEFQDEEFDIGYLSYNRTDDNYYFYNIYQLLELLHNYENLYIRDMILFEKDVSSNRKMFDINSSTVDSYKNNIKNEVNAGAYIC